MTFISRFDTYTNNFSFGLLLPSLFLVKNSSWILVSGEIVLEGFSYMVKYFWWVFVSGEIVWPALLLVLVVPLV